MTISLDQLITNLQADVDAVDSSTSMSSILTLMHKARKLTGISNYYDSVGQLPIDVKYDGMLAFSKADNTMYKFVDSGENSGTVGGWHQADSAVYSSPGALAPLPAADMRGTVHGYSVSGNPNINDVNKYSYVSDNNITDIGDFGPLSPSLPTTSLYAVASGDGPVGGYIMGGIYTPYDQTHNIIRYPYANEIFVDTGYDIANSGYPGGYNYHTCTVGTRDYVYHSGGIDNTPSPTTYTKPSDWLDIIGKFNAASEANGTDVGDLTQVGGLGSQASSSTHGYRFCGYNQQVNDTIDKWAFASDGNASSPGNMAYRTPGTPSSNNQRYNVSGHSDTKAYIFEGRRSPGQESAVAPFMNEVVTHTYASDASSGIGALDLDTTYGGTATSSSVAVYRAGGYDAVATANITRVAKLDTSTEATMTDIGDLTTATRYGAMSSGPTG